MALNWKHMKGFWRGENTSANDMMYTFINFKDAISSGEDLLPDIYINDSNTDASGGTNYGHIVTNNCSNTFKQRQNFLTTTSLAWVASQGSSPVASIDQNGSRLRIKDNTSIYLSIGDNNYLTVTSTDTCTYNTVTLNSISGTDAEARNADLRVVGFSNFAKAVKMGSTLTVTSSCEAQFFNAKSDIRAKENIIPLDFNALDFIKNLNLYSFNYIDNSQPSIGIIAQEVQDIDIQGFSLVDNKEASGKNNDYMSIKESKLIYVLCKAVKELEAEVESLKAQLYGK